jgi:hypothetical protein
MKFKMISEEDVKAIRAARKALTRIAKKTRRLCDAEKAALGNPKKDWKPVALECWRMLDEVDALGLTESSGEKGREKLRIRLVPSGEASKEFPL